MSSNLLYGLRKVGTFIQLTGLPGRPVRQPVFAGCTRRLCDRQLWLVTKSTLEVYVVHDDALYKLTTFTFTFTFSSSSNSCSSNSSRVSHSAKKIVCNGKLCSGLPYLWAQSSGMICSWCTCNKCMRAYFNYIYYHHCSCCLYLFVFWVNVINVFIIWKIWNTHQLWTRHFTRYLSNSIKVRWRNSFTWTLFMMSCIKNY